MHANQRKNRIWVKGFRSLKYAIEELERISNTNDAKLGIEIDYEDYKRCFSNYSNLVFNHSARWNSYHTSKLMFLGDSLAAVYDRNYYNFRLDERTKESEDSYIEGEI